MTTPDTKRPHLLLVNDDGIEAEGLAVLARVLEPVGDLTIIAPTRERSGSGHAITVVTEMGLAPFERDGRMFGWSLDGSPADCVKVAMHLFNRDRPYDLCVSGINRGVNTGRLVLYSGTAAGAREATMLGIPSIALSSYFTNPRKVHYEAAGLVGLEIVERVLAEGLPAGIMLNVNVPDVPYEEIAGWSATRMGFSTYSDLFEHKTVEGRPHPATVCNVGNRWELSDPAHPDFDDQALAGKRVSITPMHYDLTAFEVMSKVEGWTRGKLKVSSLQTSNPGDGPSK